MFRALFSLLYCARPALRIFTQAFMPVDSAIAEASFISLNAASYIASTHVSAAQGGRAPTLTISAGALRDLNAFLDYFLAIIIKETLSTNLQDLKSTLARVLDSALGYVALNEAQAELETYRVQETGAGCRFEYDNQGIGTDDDHFDVEEVWLQARVRCMIYSTVGEKEEVDFPVLSTETSITPPIAIFLTAILEFLAEHILLTSARFSRDRLDQTSKGILNQEDLDRGIRMDKVLGTIWQSYLAILPGRNRSVRRIPSAGTTDSAMSAKVFSTLPFSPGESSFPRSHRNQGERSSSLHEAPHTRSFAPNGSPTSLTTSAEKPTQSESQNISQYSGLSNDAHLSSEPEALETIPEVGQLKTERLGVFDGLASVAPLNPARAAASASQEIESSYMNATPVEGEGFESTVFQWNSRRLSTQSAANIGELGELEARKNSIDEPSQVKLQSLSVLDEGSSKDVATIEPVQRQAPIVPRAGQTFSMTSPRPSLSLTARTLSGNDYTMQTTGLGIRDVSRVVEPESDFATFLKSELVRESSPTIYSEAEARRQRIIAARHAALARQTNQPSLPEVEGQSQRNLSDIPASRRASDAPEASVGPLRSESSVSPTMRLAAFLRNTGTLQATKPANTNLGLQKQLPIQRLPETRVHEPRDSQGDSGIDSDEDLMVHQRRRGESLAEFLRNAPPPLTNEDRPMYSSLSEPKSGPASRAIDQASDKLIAGPAYSSPVSPQLASEVTPLQHNVRSAKPLPDSLARPLPQRLRPGSPRAPVAYPLDAHSDSDDEDLDETIFGRPNRKPPMKESLADFLKNSSPPNYDATQSNPSGGMSTSSSNRSISKIGRRLSSLSILVGVNNSRKTAEEGVVAPTPSTPSRPNYRPLMG